MKQSKKYSLNWHDALKGFVTASLTSAIFYLQDALDSGTFELHWKKLAIAFVSGGVGYLIKNFFTDTEKQNPTD